MPTLILPVLAEYLRFQILQLETAFLLELPDKRPSAEILQKRPMHEPEIVLVVSSQTTEDKISLPQLLDNQLGKHRRLVAHHPRQTFRNRLAQFLSGDDISL